MSTPVHPTATIPLEQHQQTVEQLQNNINLQEHRAIANNEMLTDLVNSNLQLRTSSSMLQKQLAQANVAKDAANKEMEAKFAAYEAQIAQLKASNAALSPTSAAKI